ncbi:glutathione S-transferase [[Emmonsia] crescens]|uniref:Glutathione S-transferase n=1 Tax=[Emmonsia] crescens TaxID=73230 RepID=A0A0G2J552_9EURO|nr:glutathione S-transferase [Emmonsia crescens UAMH 3008]
MANKNVPAYQDANPGGQFRRQPSVFRSSISRSPTAPFPAERDRYVLYINTGCPWAHRANIVRTLKGLEPIIQLVVLDSRMSHDGWYFSGEYDSVAADPLYGFKNLKELYLRADPTYYGRYTVPVLWDKQKETIVSNESGEIIRFMYEEFDGLLVAEDEGLREVNRPGGGLYPEHLRGKIDEMNEWVYETVNNGVYKCGFATAQEAYDKNIYPLFASLDRIEEHLGQPGQQPYLFGEHITEADIRLYTTLIRFDVAYHGIFKCNLKMIRHDYPRIHRWLRTLYWDESERTRGGAFKKTTLFEVYKIAYLTALQIKLGSTDKIVSAGPSPDILPLDGSS